MSPFEQLAIVLFEQLGEAMCETSSKLSRLLNVSHSEAHGIVDAVCVRAMKAHEAIAQMQGDADAHARGKARVEAVSVMFDEIMASFRAKVAAGAGVEEPAERDEEVAAALAALMRGKGHSA